MAESLEAKMEEAKAKSDQRNPLSSILVLEPQDRDYLGCSRNR